MKQLRILAMAVVLLSACGNDDKLTSEKTNDRIFTAALLKSEILADDTPPETRQEKVEALLRENKFGDFIEVDGLQTPEPYYLRIEYKGKENLSEKMKIRSIQLTVRDAVYAIKELGLPIENVQVNVKYPIIDKYGNANDHYVIKSNYSAATVKSLNEDRKNFKEENLPIVADEWWAHHTLRPKE